MNVQSNVLERYSESANKRQKNLCCPVDYNASLLKLLPQKIIDKDYGCDDPYAICSKSDIVLDLSSSGKICYMAVQLVGDKSKVICVDINNGMLGLARKHQDTMAKKQIVVNR